MTHQATTVARKAREHWVITFIGLLASVFAIYQGTHGLAPDAVDRPLAEKFLVHYYASASKDPTKCCLNELDGTYLADHPAVRQHYVSFFRQFKAIRVGFVRDTPDGYFKALVTYRWAADGKPPTSETDRFKLVCSQWTEIPRVTCGVGDIKIDDVVNRFH